MTPDTLLSRDQAAAALSDLGWPLTACTLSVYSTRKSGPAVLHVGQSPRYAYGDLVAFVDHKLATGAIRSVGRRRATMSG